MEQPPGSLDELQPQDLSTSSIPTVIDLTRKGEECVLNANSLEALRMVKNPSWYPNSGTSKTGLPSFSETASSDIRLQSGDQIQPDNAFSNTTVTLSYVSRSHVFSTHDSLSQHSPLYGVPSIGKFSLHPPCDSDKGLGETGYALSQHYLEQVDRPMDLAAQTELFQAQVGEENDVGVCLTQQSHEINGGVVSGDGDTDTPLQSEADHSLSRDTENGRGLENGQGDSWSGSGACVESSPETLTPVSGEHQDGGGSEVLLLISRTQEPVVIPDSVGARDLCSLSREYISPLEDPVSPSATSLDDVDDVFVLPQASSSPSGDNSFLEATDEAAWDGLNREGPIQSSVPVPRSSSSDSTPRLDTSNEHKQTVHRRKAVLEPMIDLTDDGEFLSNVLEEKPNKTSVVPHMNGNTSALQRTLKKKELPVRSGRGTRLEAIVMNINPNRYKVSGCIRTAKKAKAFQTAASVSNLASPKKNDTALVGKKKGRVKASISAKKKKQKAATPLKRGKTNSINTDSCKESTSDSEIINNSKNSLNSTPPKMSSPQFAVHKKSKKEPEDFSPPEHSPQASPNCTVHTKSKKKTEQISHPQPSPQSSPQFAGHKKSKKEPEHISQPDSSPEIHVARMSPPPKSPKKRPSKGKATGSKQSPAAKVKAAHPPKRRRKKHKPRQSSSMFSPNEPEIKLRYVNYKEEKRDLRLDTFSPFVRVQRKQSSPSLCTVINYPEEVKPQHKKGQQQQGHFMSGVVPSTSCLQLGRASTHSQHQRSLVCCLCGQSANAMDLGDLHGPYYPEGYRPSAKTPASAPGLKEDEEDYSDSDSSSCSVRGRGRKCTRAPAPWPLRPGSQLKQEDLLGSHPWTDDVTGSPAAKRARLDAGSAAVEDWYSPPVVPQEACEHWLHEDCGIWSAGVFLVKGRVYGLEEAVKVAQETMCSGCRNPGATLGCFFKGCPNKYHYRCALESDCVLIEENFSMKCKKHKNKTFKAPPGNRWDDR
ncbi:retinoic acid-induced protein 1 [Centroberyx affinis]|uniref:retinoic acid-induced protein 1 n=1 Tax=Centroberyx affinis TaxID=166261 RepID=UPI003A5BB9CD